MYGLHCQNGGKTEGGIITGRSLPGEGGDDRQNAGKPEGGIITVHRDAVLGASCLG